MIIQEWINLVFDECNSDGEKFYLIKNKAQFHNCLNIISSSDDYEKKEKYINFLTECFQKSPINAIFFSNSVSTLNENFCDWVIKEYIKDDNKNYQQLLLNLLQNLINIFGVTRHNADLIYESMSKNFFYKDIKNVQSNKEKEKKTLLQYFTLLNIIYGMQNTNQKPKNFFYFYGVNSICLTSTTLNQTHKIKDSFCFLFSFMSNKQKDFYDTSQIFSVKFDNLISISLVVEKGIFVLSYHSDSKEDKSYNVTNITHNSWINMSLIFSVHKSKKSLFTITVIINSDVVSNIDIQSEKGAPVAINEITLFKNFYGASTSFIFLIKALKNEEIFQIQKDFPYGLYKTRLFNQFLQSYPNLESKIFLIFIPNYSTETDEILEITGNDSFKCSFLSTLNEEEKRISWCHTNLYLHNKIPMLGGVNNLLPIFEIMVKGTINQDIFEKYFSLTAVLVTRSEYNIKDALENKFFESLSLLMEKIPKIYYTKSIFSSIISIASELFAQWEKTPLCDVFLKCFVFNKEIYSKFEIEDQINLWEFISSSFGSNRLLLRNFITISELMFIIKEYDCEHNEKFCCENHAKTYNIEELNDKEVLITANVMKPELLCKVSNLLDLCEIVLFFDDTKHSNLFSLVNYLPTDMSQCLLEKLLQILINYFSKLNTKIDLSVKVQALNTLIKNNFLDVLGHIQHLSFLSCTEKVVEIYNLISEYRSVVDDIKHYFTKENPFIFYLTKNIYPIYSRVNLGLIEQETENIIVDCNSPVSQFSVTNRGNSDIENTFEKILRTPDTKRKITDSSNEKFVSSNNKGRKSYFNINIEKKIPLTSPFQLEQNISPTMPEKLDKPISTKGVRHRFFKMKTLKNVTSSIQFAKFQISSTDNREKEEIDKEKEEYENEKKKYFKKTPLLNVITKSALNSYSNSTLEILMKWLTSTSSLEGTVQKNSENLEITNEYVIEMIVQLLVFSDISLLNTFFNKLVSFVIIDNPNSKANAKHLFNNKDLYQLLIEVLFQCYLISVDESREIFLPLPKNNIKEYAHNLLENGILIHSLILLQLDTQDAKMLFRNLFSCCTLLKRSFSNSENKQNDTTKNFIANFIRRIFNEIIKHLSYNKADETKHIELNLQIAFYFFQFVIFFNIEHIEDLRNELNNSKEFFPIFIVNSLNISKRTKNNLIVWSDDEVCNKIINTFSPLFDIEKYKVTFIFSDINNIKKINETFLNKKKLDLFTNNISMLTKDIQEGVKLSLIKILTTFFCLSILMSSNVNKHNENLEKMKKFIFFSIVSSSNLSTNETNLQIQNEFYENISYIIFFAFEQSKRESLDENYRKNYQKFLCDIFSLLLLVTYNGLSQINKKKKKSKIFKMITIHTKKKKMDISKTASYKIITEDYKTFTEAKIKEIVENNFSKINDELLAPNFQENLKGLDLLKMKIKDIFEIDFFDKEGKQRLYNANKTSLLTQNSSGFKNHFFNFEYYQAQSKIEIKVKNSFGIVCEEILRYWEKKEIYTHKKKKYYKKNKKKLFSFNSMWSNKEIFSLEQNLETPTKLKYKILNHFGAIPFKPILFPILDIVHFIPAFSQYDKKNLFINQESPLQIANLEVNEILNSSIQNAKSKNLSIIIDKPEQIITELVYSSSTFTNFQTYYNKISSLLSKNEENYPSSSIIINGFICCYVTQSKHIKGYFNINQNDIYFSTGIYRKNDAIDVTDEDYNVEHNSCYGSFFKTSNDYKAIQIPFKEIKYIFLRRYYYKNSAIEIYTNNKAYYFNFQNEKIRSSIMNQLFLVIALKRDIKSECNGGALIGYEILHSPEQEEHIPIKTKRKSSNNSYQLQTSENFLADKVDRWLNWKISTFEFLIWINILSNRSYNDLTQYPVFPWIFSQYSNNTIGNEPNVELRDLTKPMGMLDFNESSKSRKDNYIEKYNSMKVDKNEHSHDLFFYGTHYSNPIYVTHYLTRVFPFSCIMIELQGNKFDDPNRLFKSVQNSFDCATTQEADVRELIPEFYFLPEMFLNNNDLNLGIEPKESNVNLPPWSYDNPFEFVSTMKKYLETEMVNKNMSKWIDLIFGYKQKGKEGENANNLFVASSYDNFHIDEVTDKDQKLYYLGIAEFGLTPHQLFSKEFSQRKKKERKQITDSAREENLQILNKAKIQSHSVKMMLIKVLSNERVMGIFNTYQYSIYKYNQSNIDSKSHIDSSTKTYLKVEDKKVTMNRIRKNCFILYNKGKCIAEGGYADAKILLCKIGESSSGNEYKVIYNDYDNSAISSMIIDKTEKYVFCGTILGSVIIYNVPRSNELVWKLSSAISDHHTQISSIAYNININVWGSLGKDNYVNLYTFPNNKKIFSFKTQVSADYLFISNSPLVSFAICSSSSNIIFCYSINGYQLSIKEEKNGKIMCPMMFNDKSFCDYLIYGTSRGFLIMRTFPNMEEICAFKISDFSIKCIDVSEDCGYCYAWTEDGQEIIAIKDPTVISEAETIMLWHMGNPFS